MAAGCRRFRGVRPPATPHTSRAPAPRSVRAAADSVAPVVMTSSTTSTRWRAAPGRLRGGPDGRRSRGGRGGRGGGGGAGGRPRPPGGGRGRGGGRGDGGRVPASPIRPPPP